MSPEWGGPSVLIINALAETGAVCGGMYGNIAGKLASVGRRHTCSEGEFEAAVDNGTLPRRAPFPRTELSCSGWIRSNC
jgi:hypothetical protein